MSPHNDRLKRLRSLLLSEGHQAFILPSHDQFMNEFPPEYGRYLAWLTGFTGSFGVAIITKDKAILYTDGRYLLQARRQLSNRWQVHDIGVSHPADFLVKHGIEAAFDPYLHTQKQIELWRKKGAGIYPLLRNPILELWGDIPAMPQQMVHDYPKRYAGLSKEQKIKQLRASLAKHHIEQLLITSADALCWLFNLRGRDLDTTPLLLGAALIPRTGVPVLFLPTTPKTLPKGISIAKLADLEQQLSQSNKPIGFDPETTSYAYADALGAHGVAVSDPCIMMKSCKTPSEIRAMKAAHIKDAVALITGLAQIEQGGITEHDVAVLLEKERAKQKDFISPSFDTIAGFKEHGAIIHYRAEAETAKKITGRGLLLIDSGGQYVDGTTDVTRVLALGKPNKEEIRAYTLVLKGHIALARAVFPEGTTGAQLDSLARYHLWQEGKDYAHGTGHGVGCSLSVHEGPQRISKQANNVPLQQGMVLSNEPGYYKEGHFGIRIENLVTLRACKNGFYGFETLTLVPFEPKLIDVTLLSSEEKSWLNDYNKRIEKQIVPLLSKEAKKWVQSKTII